MTNAVIDPSTKDNIETYIVKDNIPIVFSLLNENMQPRQAILRNYYYTTFDGKNIKIRCLDTSYFGGTLIRIAPESIYEVLKVTNRLDDCLFIFEFEYVIKNRGVDERRLKKFAFKIASDKEYEMYQNIEKPLDIDDSPDIRRPKRPKKVDN